MLIGSTQGWAQSAILICLVVLPFALAYRRNNMGASAVATACALGAVLLFYPQVQSLQFGILKAEMRDKIEEASATLTQVRGLTADLARVAVLGVVEQGGLGGPSVQTFYVIRKNLERQLIVLHASPADIKNILEPLGPRIQTAFEIEIENRALLGKEQSAAWVQLYECLSPFRQNPVVEKMHACIEKLSTLTPETEQLLKELDHFQKTGDIPRLDANANR